MVVQGRGDPAEGAEIVECDRALVGFRAGHHVEMHDVARGSVGVDGDHTPAVAGGQHRRHRDVAVLAQRGEPVELGFDLVRAVVVLPVHPQDRFGAAVGVLDQIGGVLRQVQQPQRGRRWQVVVGQCTFGHVDVVGDDLRHQ